MNRTAHCDEAWWLLLEASSLASEELVQLAIDRARAAITQLKLAQGAANTRPVPRTIPPAAEVIDARDPDGFTACAECPRRNLCSLDGCAKKEAALKSARVRCPQCSVAHVSEDGNQYCKRCAERNRRDGLKPFISREGVFSDGNGR